MYWDIVEVIPKSGYRLFVRFRDGLEGLVHLRREQLTGALEPLRNERFFEKAFIADGTVAWPGEIDLAPDALYTDVAAQQTETELPVRGQQREVRLRRSFRDFSEESSRLNTADLVGHINGDQPMNAPVVFISYSHDSQEHRSWVAKLATDLRTNGVDAILDQWDLALGQDMSLFMQDRVASSDRVIMVCSEEYVKKADGASGGVGYERLIITSEVIANIHTKKFVPIIRANGSSKKIPQFMGPRMYVDFTRDDDYATSLELLVREIHNSPALAKPPLGSKPFSGSVIAAGLTLRAVGPTGITVSGTALLDDSWFTEHANTATTGHAKLGFKALMEIRFALHSPVNKSQLELLNAVRKSEIHTFGWPIGIMLQNRDEYRPRPITDGIRAEVSIQESAPSGRPSYDYWALRSNGDFYLLQSLFEDDRDPNAVFFNSRLVRVTEALLFGANLYEALGAPGDTKLSIRISHRGIAGRTLSSSSPTRRLFESRKTDANESQAEFVEEIGQLRANIVEDVRKITEPLFMLFDFAQFNSKVYEEIVTAFVDGRPT